MAIKTVNGVSFYQTYCSSDQCQHFERILPDRDSTRPIKYLCNKYDSFLETEPPGRRVRNAQCITDNGT